MNNLNDTLPDLMRRATDGLEPVSADLVERGMRRGVTLRRRRTALRSVSGAGAVLATAGIVFGGSQLLGSHAGAPVAGTPNTVKVTKNDAAKPPTVTSKDTLATLKKLLPTGLKTSQPRGWGGDFNGFSAASVVVNDGKGAGMVSALVETSAQKKTCADAGSAQCTVRPDGSVVVSMTETPEYSTNRNPGGVTSNVVEIYHPNGTKIGLTSYNAPQEKGAAHTRPKPALSVAKLISMGDSKLWKFPAESKVKPWLSPAETAAEAKKTEEATAETAAERARRKSATDYATKLQEAKRTPTPTGK
jgi:hypothetical protein